MTFKGPFSLEGEQPVGYRVERGLGFWGLSPVLRWLTPWPGQAAERLSLPCLARQ